MGEGRIYLGLRCQHIEGSGDMETLTVFCCDVSFGSPLPHDSDLAQTRQLGVQQLQEASEHTPEAAPTSSSRQMMTNPPSDLEQHLRRRRWGR